MKIWCESILFNTNKGHFPEIKKSVTFSFDKKSKNKLNSRSLNNIHYFEQDFEDDGFSTRQNAELFFIKNSNKQLSASNLYLKQYSKVIFFE